jgi:hypothetical protein
MRPRVILRPCWTEQQREKSLCKTEKIENFNISKHNPRVSGQWIKKRVRTLVLQIVIYQNDGRTIMSIDIFSSAPIGVVFKVSVVIKGFENRTRSNVPLFQKSNIHNRHIFGLSKNLTAGTFVRQFSTFEPLVH